MSGVWIFAEQRDGKFRQVVFEMLGAGRQLADHLNEPLVAVVFGRACGELVKPLAEHGADRVVTAEHDLLAEYTTDGWSRPLADLARAEQPSAILFAHSSIGRDLAPAVAVDEERLVHRSLGTARLPSHRRSESTTAVA